MDALGAPCPTDEASSPPQPPLVLDHLNDHHHNNVHLVAVAVADSPYPCSPTTFEPRCPAILPSQARLAEAGPCIEALPHRIHKSSTTAQGPYPSCVTPVSCQRQATDAAGSGLLGHSPRARPTFAKDCNTVSLSLGCKVVPCAA